MKIWTVIAAMGVTLVLVAPAGSSAVAGAASGPSASVRHAAKTTPSSQLAQALRKNAAQAATIRRLTAENAALAAKVRWLDRRIELLVAPGPWPVGVRAMPAPPDPDDDCRSHMVCTPEQDCRLWGNSCHLQAPSAAASVGAGGGRASEEAAPS